jgi:type IV pilus assembly protein PilF
MKRLIICFALMFLLGCASLGNRSTSSKVKRDVNPSAKVHTELAGLYYERAQLGIALGEIDLALDADRDHAPAYNVRGLIRMALRDFDEAEDDFKRSLRIDPTDSEAHNNYGWFLCQRGKAAESVSHFMSALKNPLYRTPDRAYLNAGLCSAKAGNIDDAEEFLQKALLIGPGMSQALFALAKLSFSNGHYETAKKHFVDFDQKRRRLNAEQLWLAINIERKTGNPNVEASYALQLRKRFPDSSEAKQLISGE